MPFTASSAPFAPSQITPTASHQLSGVSSPNHGWLWKNLDCPGESTHVHLIWMKQFKRQQDDKVTLVLSKGSLEAKRLSFPAHEVTPTQTQESRKPPLTESVEMSRVEISTEKSWDSCFPTAFTTQHLAKQSATSPHQAGHTRHYSIMTLHTTPLLLQLLSFWNFCSSTVLQIASTLWLCQTWRGSRRDRCVIHTPTLLPLISTSTTIQPSNNTDQATAAFLFIRLPTGACWKSECFGCRLVRSQKILKKQKHLSNCFFS